MSEAGNKSWFRDGGPLGIENYKKAFAVYIVVAVALFAAALYSKTGRF